MVILALGVWLCLRRQQRRSNLQIQQDLENANTFPTKRGYEMMPSSSKSTVTVEITAGNSTHMQELDSRTLPLALADVGADVKRSPVAAVPLSTANFSSGRETSTGTSTGSLAQNIEPVELDSRPITSASLQSNQVPSILVPAPWRWQHNHNPTAETPNSISPTSPDESTNAEDKMAPHRKRS